MFSNSMSATIPDSGSKEFRTPLHISWKRWVLRKAGIWTRKGWSFKARLMEVRGAEKERPRTHPDRDGAIGTHSSSRD